MKKNKMMRLASVLLVMVLLTTSVIGGTFAKYVTTDSATDSARVAKWGVTVEVTGNEAFADYYATTDNSLYTGTNSVVSSGTAGDAVLAPGTSGTLGTIRVTGTPEVAVVVETIVDLELGAGWKFNSGTDGEQDSLYFPVIIKVAGTAVDVNSCTTLDEIETAVETAIIKAILHADSPTLTASGTGNTAKTTYDPNEAALADSNAISVTWEWPFSSTNDANDVKDTYLGNNTNNVTISASITVTVTQID